MFQLYFQKQNESYSLPFDFLVVQRELGIIEKNDFLKINKENLREWIIKYLEPVSLEVNKPFKNFITLVCSSFLKIIFLNKIK